ncbi:hypothetical protein LguiA_023017 [Lonicera macranthoides]
MIRILLRGEAKIITPSIFDISRRPWPFSSAKQQHPLNDLSLVFSSRTEFKLAFNCINKVQCLTNFSVFTSLLKRAQYAYQVNLFEAVGENLSCAVLSDPNFFNILIVIDNNNMKAREYARKILKMDDNLVLLPMGTTAPPSSPSAEDLGRVTNQSLFTIHLAKIDRILQSVPSPGAGH